MLILMLSTQFNAFFVFSLMLFFGITTFKKKTPRADQWVLSIAVMCALDEAESLEAFHTLSS